MKLASILSIAAVSAAGLAGVSNAAVISSSDGDVVLGFVSTNPADASHNLTVKLGRVSDFLDADGNAKVNYTTTLTQLSVADISSIYGANWNTRNDLNWAVAGVDHLIGDWGTFGLNPNTTFLTKARSSASLNTQTTPFATLSEAALASPGSKLNTLFVGAPKSLNGKTSTANSNFAADIISGGANDGSWNGQNAQGSGFGTSYDINNKANIPVGSYAVSDFYELSNDGAGTAASVYIGSFILSNLGVLSFTTDVASFIGGGAVIPEPSTYAAFIGAAVLGFSALRRRKVATA